MISLEDANACIEAAAADLKQLSYEELENLAERKSTGAEDENRQIQIGAETVYISTTLAKFGHFRRRVSVEMVLGAQGECEWERTPCIYFERFESGRLYVARAKGWETVLFDALPYAFLGGVVIALVALVWHLFLRTG